MNLYINSEIAIKKNILEPLLNTVPWEVSDPQRSRGNPIDIEIVRGNNESR